MNAAERRGRELTAHTPMRLEGLRGGREREEAHRALPAERQPFMVVYFGILDYGVLWIGEPGPEGEAGWHREKRKKIAEREMKWWAEQFRTPMWLLPFTREPSPHDLQVRQQWDLDKLTEAILSSYR